MDEPVEVYLLPATSHRCIICNPSPEALVGGLYGDGFTLCPSHLLRLQTLSMREAGLPTLREIERTDE